MPHLTDPGDKAFADMGIKLEEVSVKITGYAAHYGASGDGDGDDGDDDSSPICKEEIERVEANLYHVHCY